MPTRSRILACLLVLAVFAASAAAPAAAAPAGKQRWLKIRVYEEEAKTPKVVVNLPLQLVEAILRAGIESGAADAAATAAGAEITKGNAGRIRIKDVDLEEIWRQLETMDGQIVEIRDGNERVSIFIE